MVNYGGFVVVSLICGFFIFMFLYFYKMCPTVLCYIANTFVHSTQNRYLDFDQVRFRLG